MKFIFKLHWNLFFKLWILEMDIAFSPTYFLTEIMHCVVNGFVVVVLVWFGFFCCCCCLFYKFNLVRNYWCAYLCLGDFGWLGSHILLMNCVIRISSAQKNTSYFAILYMYAVCFSYAWLLLLFLKNLSLHEDTC